VYVDIGVVDIPFMVALRTPINTHNIAVLREIICWDRKFWQVLYIPALSE
jgi:hypothetical protein